MQQRRRNSARRRRSGAEILPHLRWDRFVDHFVDQFARVLGIDRVVAIGVNDLALIVHHVVEIERAFASEIIALLDPFLRGLDRLVQPWMLEFLAFLEAEALHDFRHAIGRAEIAHEIVFEADVKARAARIALARATSAQLPIDAARFVPLRADDKQAALDPARPAPSLMSVPRPAMLVEIVTVPACPARCTISASCMWYFAFSTLCGIFSRFSIRLSNSDASTLTVPTSTGCARRGDL